MKSWKLNEAEENFVNRKKIMNFLQFWREWTLSIVSTFFNGLCEKFSATCSVTVELKKKRIVRSMDY